MADSTEQGPEGNGIAESRAYPRAGVHSLAYIELGDGNAGIVLNISETGLAVQTIQILSRDQFSQMTFRLPKTDEPIEASGKVVWQIRAKKQAGIEFVGLPDATRAAIKNWMAEQLRPLETAAEEAPAALGQVGPAPQQPTDPFAQIGAGAAIAQPRPGAQDAVDAMQEPATPSTVPPIENPLSLPSPGVDAPESSVDRDIRRLLLGTPGSVPLPHFGYMPPGTAARNLKNPRPWLTFAATAGLLAAAAFVALTTFVPGAITRAKMTVLAHLEGPRAGEQTADQTDQPQNTAQEQAANTPQSGSPATATPDAQGGLPTVLPGDTDTASDSRNGVVPTSNQPEQNPAVPAQTTEQPSRSSATGQENARTQPQSAVAPAHTGAYHPLNDSIAPQNQTESHVGTTGRTEPQTRTASGNTSDQYANGTADTPSPTTAGNSDRRNAEREGATAGPSGNSPGTARTSQSPSVPPTEGQAALNAWRAQTAPSSGSSTNSSHRTEPVEPDQDLYARRDSASSPGIGTNQNTSAAQQAKSFEMPNSYSSPVEPSLPLSGIPSGSVAASSQFRGIVGQNPTAGQLQIGQLVSSYSPAYPIEAAREGIEGTVKLSVLVRRDGAVRNIRIVSGPAILTSVAAAAVRDWRYGETFLAGQPIETEQYVTIVFRLSGK
ncbi:MAG TPA: TonB family protein [Candidatus Cybelea sp.]|nr:TonB family protein [Candidatus Cybelea sp.]